MRVVEQRRPDGFGCFAHVDISLLKQRQHRLLRAEERARQCATRLAAKSALLDTMLDRIEIGVVLIDAQGSIEVCNRPALELLGLSEALMAGKPALDDVRALHWLRHPVCDCFERRQADGRVVAVQSVALAGGAVLHTFSGASAG